MRAQGRKRKSEIARGAWKKPSSGGIKRAYRAATVLTGGTAMGTNWTSMYAKPFHICAAPGGGLEGNFA